MTPSIAVLTGAGISTDSGIPDFRGPNGVWTKNPKSQAMFTLQNYLADPELRRQSWRNRREHAAWSAVPNNGHCALVELEHSGRLRALITQNIDGLHQKAGSTDVIELHGTLYGAECLGCRARMPMSGVLERVAAGEEDPPCLTCGGILKSATVSFGQHLDTAVLRRAQEAARDCAEFYAVGTSLTVQPAAGLARLAARHGARLVIVNAEPTPYDALADLVVRDPIGQVLPDLLGVAVA